MEYLTSLTKEELLKFNGGQDEPVVLTGYPGQSLVNFVWKTLKAAYQKGYDDKLLNVEPCRYY